MNIDYTGGDLVSLMTQKLLQIFYTIAGHSSGTFARGKGLRENVCLCIERRGGLRVELSVQTQTKSNKDNKNSFRVISCFIFICLFLSPSSSYRTFLKKQKSSLTL